MKNKNLFYIFGILQSITLGLIVFFILEIINIEKDTNKQIDLLIVVDQMLTGFDSKWINTLYLDKILEYANVIQAFSRTNRLFGMDKPFGTIRYYRKPHTMQENINKAIKLYSGDKPLGLFVDRLEDNIAALENGFGGIATSSGMGAVTAIHFASLGQGARMISTASVYGPSRGVMEQDFSRFGVESSYVDTSDVENIKAAIKPNTKVLYIKGGYSLLTVAITNSLDLPLVRNQKTYVPKILE